MSLLKIISLFISLQFALKQSKSDEFCCCSVYDVLRNQCVPFKPLIGQLFHMRRAVKDGNDIVFWTNLPTKHGYLSLFCLGPLTDLFVSEPDIIGGVLDRSYAQNCNKPTLFLVPLSHH
jgi:hypothetical protein